MFGENNIYSTFFFSCPQKIQEVVVDVSNFDALKKTADMIFNDPCTESVHFLMNNAAVQLGGSALSTSMDEFNKVLSVNTLGPIHACQAFVPLMQNKNQCGLIVNTGSKQGITMPPGNLTYNVSKAALKTWTEGLEHELMMERINGGRQLRAALLVPGWVNTSIALKESRARAEMEGKAFDVNDVFFHEGKPAPGAWMPKQVIDFMLEKLNDGKFYIICPDNDVDRETDNIRMTWTMQDITQDRPPLSRWHPEWKDKFTDHLEECRKKE